MLLLPVEGERRLGKRTHADLKRIHVDLKRTHVDLKRRHVELKDVELKDVLFSYFIDK